MQPRRPRTIEAEPAQQDHAGDRVGRLGKAGPRQVMVDEALGVKRPSSRWTTRCSRWRWTTSSSIVPVSSKTTGRIGDARANPRASGRAGEDAERVHRLGPGRIGPPALVECGKDESSGRGLAPASSRAMASAALPPSAPERSDGGAEVVLGRGAIQSWKSSDVLASRLIWAFRSSWRSRDPSSSSSTAACSRPPGRSWSISASRSVTSRCRIPWLSVVARRPRAPATGFRVLA